MRIFSVLAALIIGTPCFATTIAFDGKHLVADSQATCGHHKIWVTKVFRSDARHASMAFAGNALRGKLIADYFMSCTAPLSAMDLAEPTKEEDAVDVLVVYDNGEALYFGGSLTAISSVSAPFTLGIGGDLALGAMVAGKTAEEAVQIACDHDIYSGGKIISVEAPKKKVPETEDSEDEKSIQGLIDSLNKLGSMPSMAPIGPVVPKK